MRRLLVFDVDGTLVPDRERITDENILAINERLKEGDAIAIASGRPYTGIKVFLDQLCPGEKYAIAANGASVYDYEGNVLDSHGLKFKDFMEFYNRHQEIIEGGTPIYCYTNDGIAYFQKNWSVQWEIDINRMKGIDLNEVCLNEQEPVLKFMIATKDPSIVDNFVFQEEDHRYAHLRTDPCFLEFVHPSTDKSVGAEFLRQRLGLSESQVYCFGDQGNDVGMIKRFRGIAMGDGIKECKEVADYITTGCRESGVAKAIYEFVLKDSGNE